MAYNKIFSVFLLLSLILDFHEATTSLGLRATSMLLKNDDNTEERCRYQNSQSGCAKIVDTDGNTECVWCIDDMIAGFEFCASKDILIQNKSCKVPDSADDEDESQEEEEEEKEEEEKEEEEGEEKKEK